MVELINITPDCDKLIAYAARTCKNSFKNSTDEKDLLLVKNCIKAGHNHILQHAQASFQLTGSRVFSHQIVRHWTGCYCQQSQRNVKVNDYIIPPSMKNHKSEIKECFNQIESLIKKLRSEYNIPLEDVRYLLPNASKTIITTTMNFRTLRSFFNQRFHASAQWEIKTIACGMYYLLTQYSICFYDFKDKFDKAVELLNKKYNLKMITSNKKVWFEIS